MTYSTSDLRTQLTKCRDRYGRVTESLFDDDPDFADHKTIVSHFGSWGEGLRQAGIDEIPVSQCPDCKQYFAQLPIHWARSKCTPSESS